MSELITHPTDPTIIALSNNSSGKIAYSDDDGTTFSEVTAITGADWTGIIVSKKQNNRYVVVNDNGTNSDQVAYSDDDGATWTEATSNFGNVNHQFGGIAYSETLGVYVVTGKKFASENPFYYSYDGEIWVGITPPGAQGNTCTAVTYSPRLNRFCCTYLTLSASHRTLTSDDGINWDVPTAAFPIDTGNGGENTKNLRDVVWAAGIDLFLVVTSSFDSTYNLFSSADGKTWNAFALHPTFFQYEAFAVSYVDQLEMLFLQENVGNDTIASSCSRPSSLNTVFGNPNDIQFVQGTKTLTLGGTLTLGSTVTSNKSTGSNPIANNTSENVTGLVFGGTKSFIAYCYVSINADVDLFSQYVLKGTNESISGDAWTLVIIRSGVTNPLITFAITAGTGQVTQTNTGYTGFSATNSTIYWDINSNIQ